MFTPPPPHTTRPDLTGTFGMAASTHWVATGVAQSVLERGGNAFDAAVAAGFVLHLVEPHLNGPGGDLVAIVAPAGDDVRVVCGQGPAPAGAGIEHYRSLGLDAVPGAGALAAAVPGAVEAWLWMLREHGTWDVADVLGYAVEHAERGLPLGRRASETIGRMAPLFREHWPSSAATWLMPDGSPPAAGAVLANPAWARTLRRLLDRADGVHGREARIDAVLTGWKTGFVARAIADSAAVPHRHSDGRDHAGVITIDDIASYEVTTEPTLRLDFRGHTVHKASFWSQGPVMLQTLAMLDRLDDTAIDPSTERGVHTLAEALKLALADRDAYYGDAADHDALGGLLTEEYAGQRVALIADTASAEFRPGTLEGVTPYLPPLETEAPSVPVEGAVAGEPTVDRSGATKGDTVHLDVVDRWGNLVAVTPSGGWLQSNPTIPELGFCLGTRLQMTWLDPTSPSALVPGRRPRTTLSPTVLSVDGVAVSAIGTPGGDQQDQWQLLYLLRTLVGGYTPQQAIDAPMFDTTGMVPSFWPRLWAPRGLEVEDRIGEPVIEGLRSRGHDVTVTGPWTLGRVSVVARDPVTGLLSAAANPRGGQGYATGR